MTVQRRGAEGWKNPDERRSFSRLVLHGDEEHAADLTDPEGRDVFERVRELYLRGPNFTNASVEHILKLRNLETIVLEVTQFTEEGVRHLQEALPHCEVQWDGLTNVR